MELILGLPHDIASECLIRYPYQQFALAASVCKGWKIEIESPEYLDGAPLSHLFLTFPNGLPLDFELTAVGSELVVLDVIRGREIPLWAGGIFKSAMAYDVKTDKWIRMSDVVKGRKNFEGAFESGRFHVIGGCNAPFEDEEDNLESEEIFNPVACCWNLVQENGLVLARTLQQIV
ncbi:F-box/kelch-repeat protein At1g80440-like [Punica granatum]|uniref:F-box/kelch-repeat protein At1g80440-like n=1 Tax=Punica granatum TaxID=22663 RepID=A0A6P8CRL4_PUNGR|nr:F-box/kelch-repeat protein At1g80440-like [Punica granatum]